MERLSMSFTVRPIRIAARFRCHRCQHRGIDALRAALREGHEVGLRRDMTRWETVRVIGSHLNRRMSGGDAFGKTIDQRLEEYCKKYCEDNVKTCWRWMLGKV